jgi:cob(I)alamin adenosyltransferase
MEGTRTLGEKHAYLDTHSKDFSNLSLGLIARASGHSLKIAYVDFEDTAKKLNQFLENLSLSTQFIKNFDKLHIETFTFKKNEKISRSIIPLVEFYSINENIFKKDLEKFDLIIFDNINSRNINEIKLKSIIKPKNPFAEIVCIFNEEKYFNKLSDEFDLITKYNFSGPNYPIIQKNIFNITGNGKGKSTYSFGYIIRNFIEKKDVKLIYFDKGGNFYGEKVFFKALKDWGKNNSLYGRFDWVSTGNQRFDGKRFRFENTPEDIREAKEGLMLLKTSLKKQTPVLAEELNTTVNSKILKVNEILEILKDLKNELVISGRNSPKEILEISDKILEVQEIKHYMYKGKGVRKGIDF